MRRRGIFAHAFRKDQSRRSGRGSGGVRNAPLLEGLEDRLVFSVGGGWVTSIQSGSTGLGFYGRYYDNAGFSGIPALTRWDNRVDFFSANGSAGPAGLPGAAVDDGDWSAVWTGTLTANFSETYSFVVNSAGEGVRLWITPEGQSRGAPLVDDLAPRGQAAHTVAVPLVAGGRYNVELDYSYASGVQQVGLQWYSPNTPLEFVEPATQVGLNVSSDERSLYANAVNANASNVWRSPDNSNIQVPVDSNYWPLADGQIVLSSIAPSDATQNRGGTYLVQFRGMATVSAPKNYLWTLSSSSVLQAGQGYDPATNTTTATIVVPSGVTTPPTFAFTNTSREPSQSLDIAGISRTGYVVTVKLASGADIVKGRKVTIAGFTGAAAGHNGTFTVTDVDTSAGTFTYKASANNLPVPPAATGVALINPGDGITDLYVMLPSTAGGDSPLPAGTLFQPELLATFGQYSALRLMDLNRTNGNLSSDWSDRNLVSVNFWKAYMPTFGDGIYAGLAPTTTAGPGAPWEVQIALANAVGKDVYISIPSNASIDYIKKLANMFAYGSDGVNPYTSPQADPVWKPLNSNLKVYVEFSNELWNYSFVQSSSGAGGWANQLSQRAIYDYLTGDRDDSLYPGGGSNAYDDGAILAAYFDVTPANADSFLKTYRPVLDRFTNSSAGSPRYFDNTSPLLNGYKAGQAWIGLRIVQISEAFKEAFGESGVDAVAVGSRVRPVVQWQYGGSWSGALPFIDVVYGDRHPVSYYLYGGGGGWYADSVVGGFSDVGFANPSFLDGLDGWSVTGSAGPVANGSDLGNPDAPPHFVPIALAGGAVQSGDVVTIVTTTKHGFAVGQTVKVAGVAVKGYNGTFTITAATATSFSYRTTVVGLSASGGGSVVGTTAGATAAYVDPGASISQDVTFSGGYADFTLVATQAIATSLSVKGLAITLTPLNGGPVVNDGAPIALSEGAFNYMGNKNTYLWSRTIAFYTGESRYTYRVTFTNTSTQRIFLTDVAVQTVNGLFAETEAAIEAGGLDVGLTVRNDVAKTSQYGLYDVGYEGGFNFNQNQAAYNSALGYQTMGSRGFSSSYPNVGMYANLDPRAQALAVRTFQQFYAAGGDLPFVFQSTGNINSWGVVVPGYSSDWDTPKQRAAAEVAGAVQKPTYGLRSGESVTNSYWWLGSDTPGAPSSVSGTYLLSGGNYLLEVMFASASAPVGQTSPVDILIDGRLVQVLNVPTRTGGKFTVRIEGLGAGRHSVTLVNRGPSTNAALATGRPGTPVATMTYLSAATPAIVKVEPTITLINPAPAITFGDAFDPSRLATVANVPGTFSYSTSSNYFAGVAAASMLDVGVHSIQVLFTPADAVHYTTATATIMVSIKKAAPTVTVTTGGRYVDSPSAVAVAVAGVDGSPSALLDDVAPTLVYYRGDSAAGEPLPAPPTSPGVYTVVAVFPGSANYLPATSSSTFTIVAAPAIMPVISSSISSLDVAFGSPIDLATFDWRDLWLTRDGGPNLVTAAVTITPASGSTYRISGLGGLTAVDGRYMMIVDGDGIFESSGRAVSGRNVFSWVKDDTIPIVAVSQGSTVSDYAAQADPVVAPPIVAIAPTVADPESAAVSSPTIPTVATIPTSEAAAAAEVQSPVEATVAPPVRIRASARLEGGPRRLLQSARPRPRLEAAPRPVHEALPRPARDALRKFARDFPIRPTPRATARPIKILSMASTSLRWLAGSQGTSA